LVGAVKIGVIYCWVYLVLLLFGVVIGGSVEDEDEEIFK
jgi:hypothetical protein